MTDIVKRLRAAAELDPWYYEVNEAAEEIERLRDALKTFADNVKELNAGIDKNWAETINPLKAENQRLRQQNERMKETLQNIASVLDDENSDYQKWALYCGDIASLCLEDIAEATGGE